MIYFFLPMAIKPYNLSLETKRIAWYCTGRLGQFWRKIAHCLHPTHLLIAVSWSTLVKRQCDVLLGLSIHRSVLFNHFIMGSCICYIQKHYEFVSPL